ncbi:Probable transmembrane protein [Polaromonas sp. CG9_12]|nr:Probable transmembrane protein [Polaromonas sp. CG9_12]
MRSAWRLIGGVGLRRAPVWIGMAAIVAMSWYYLVRMDRAQSAMHGGASAHAGMAMGGDGVSGLLTAFGMWAVMMMAMMLPTVAPSAAVFSSLSARRNPARTNGATAVYVAGYAASWIAFAAPAALMQWSLTYALLLDPMARSTSTMLSAAILLAAGVYQWLPLKSACLSRCRTPLAFFMANWRDLRSGAFWLGLRHGGYCVGCCWALMAAMFAVGAMSLAWMGLIMLLVLSEKVIPASWRFDKALGLALVAAGLWIAAGI